LAVVLASSDSFVGDGLMYKTIKGIYKKGQIIPKEQIDFVQDEIEIFITFLEEENLDQASLSSTDELLYTMGDRAVEGKFRNASERHDQYLYSPGKE
jgi:hypothetical protein